MTVYKRGKTWRAEIYFMGKRRAVKAGFKNKREAKKWYDEKYAGYLFRNGNEPEVKAVTFNQLITKFSRVHLPTIRPSTVRKYKTDLNLRIIPFFDYYKLESINSFMVDEFKSGLLQSLSPKSVNNCLALLKLIFRKAVEWGMSRNDPAKHVTLLRLQEKKYNWWQNKEDIKKFLDVAKESRYYIAFRLALDLGMRLGEIVGLNVGDVSLKLLQIHVHRQWIDKQKSYGPTKQGRERFLKVDSESTLAKLLRINLEGKFSDEPIVTTDIGTRVHGNKLSTYHFRRLMIKAGVPRIRFHDLRHTFASWYMINNDNIWELRRILGHADIQTTQKYAHLSSLHRVIPEPLW